jgi:hypothetical protein
MKAAKIPSFMPNPVAQNSLGTFNADFQRSNRMSRIASITRFFLPHSLIGNFINMYCTSEERAFSCLSANSMYMRKNSFVKVLVQ